MASEGGTEAYSLALARRLAEAPDQFDFFQAVRRIENLHPDMPRTGHARQPTREPVRFCQEPSLAFAPRTLDSYRTDATGIPKLYVNFFGLLGPNGPMPMHITDYVRQRVYREHDRSMARFLDMFHHRLIAFFYRAWATNQQTVNFERGEQDAFARYIGSLFGIGMWSFRNRDAVPDVAKLHYSGHLVCQTRHPEGLCSILQDYYGIDVELSEFVGQWLDVPAECVCRLGETPETGSLGWTAIVGSRVWESQQKFRLRFGPMKLAEYERLLPGGDSLRRLLAWVKNYLADELQWDVQLILKEEEVPSVEMGTFGRLGWTTWLTSRPLGRDADDLVLQPQQAEGM